jgi:PEGA domain
VRRTAATIWLTAVAGLLSASISRAQGIEESLTKEGIELRRAGRDSEALAVFQRALAADGSPRTRAQVGLAEQALGFWVEAERDLSAALEAGKDAWFQQHQTALHRALEVIRAHLATLEVVANVSGAELWINGSRAGVLPLASPLRVVAGTMTVEVRAPGFETQTRSVEVAAQAQGRQVIELAPMVAPIQETKAAGDVKPKEVLSRPPNGSENRSPPEKGGSLRTGAWVSLASAVVLLAGSGVALLVRNTEAAAYNDDQRCFYGRLTRDQRCGSYRNAGSVAQTIAVIDFEAAVAAGALSVVLFTLAPKVHPLQVAAIRCQLGLGIACGTSF